MKKKVIIVTQALWCGGIETALINLLNHFDYDKYEVTLLTLQAIFDFDMKARVHPKCRLLAVDRERNHSFKRKYKFARVYHITEQSDNMSLFHKAMMWSVPVIRWIENRLYIRYIRNLMKQELFDTCIIYSDIAAETAIRSIQADKFLMFYHHGAMRHVYHDEIAYRKCEKIIAVSENQAVELRRFVPAAAEKIVAIHNLTDIEGIREKASLQTEEKFDTSKFNIVSVGRVSHEKGMDIAVRACSRLIADGYEDIRWWIVGGGPAMSEVMKTIAETHMEKYVITVGMKSNPYPYIRQADLYVQPSRFEGYPMTVLEALILGQPVISTDNNGAKEIIKENISGVLRTIDADAIGKAIEYLLQNPDVHKTLKSNVLSIDFEEWNKEATLKLEQLI